jgi:hypothetical protein
MIYQSHYKSRVPMERDLMFFDKDIEMFPLHPEPITQVVIIDFT